jgi:hypothetical protein
MMPLSKELVTRKGDRVRFDDFSGPLVQIIQGETGRIRDYTSDRNQEWFLEATARVTFWANKAQFYDFKRDAQRQLMRYLYSDVWLELARLRSAVNDGDKEACWAALGRIDRVLDGELE